MRIPYFWIIVILLLTTNVYGVSIPKGTTINTTGSGSTLVVVDNRLNMDRLIVGKYGVELYNYSFYVGNSYYNCTFYNHTESVTIYSYNLDTCTLPTENSIANASMILLILIPLILIIIIQEIKDR